MRNRFVLALAVCAGVAQAESYLVLARGSGEDLGGVAASVTASGGVVTAALPEVGVVLAQAGSPNFAAAVARNPKVQGVAADPVRKWTQPRAIVEASDVRPLGVNSEPYFGYQWNLRQIGADQAAAAGITGNGLVRARVAVLDSGIICDHPDLAPNLNVGLSASFVPGEGVCAVIPEVFHHGSHVAGIIAAPINNRGVQGVAPGAEIVAVKVLAEEGGGSFGWIIQGILYASGAGVRADVMNLSLGATFDRVNAGGDGVGLLIAALNRAVDLATTRGTLVVSAAGNEGVDLNSRLWSIPAQSGNGMAVSATGPVNLADFDRLAAYSNYGQSVISVAAPGGDDTLYPDPNYVWDMIIAPAGFSASASGKKSWWYAFADGTSMAAPHVSGVAALVVGRFGHMPPAILRSILERTAVDILKRGADPGSGHGRIDAWAAVQ